MRKQVSKSLGKPPVAAEPETPFERGLSGSGEMTPRPPTITNPRPKDAFAPGAKPPVVTGEQQAKDYFAPGAQPPTVSLDPPVGVRVDAPAWMIGVKNAQAARQAQVLKPHDLFAPGTSAKTTAELIAEREAGERAQRDALMAMMNPQMARIDAAREALDAVFAERPELAEQAKLSMPNQAQLGVAGLAALLQPGRAFESLAQPFQFQQEEQQRQQQINNQQFASDKEAWGLMWRQAGADLENEIGIETNRQKNALGAYESFEDRVSDQYTQDQLTKRTAMTIEGRYTVQQLKGAQDFARAQMQEIARTERELIKSPEETAARIQQRLMERGVDQQTAFQIAWSEVQSDYYKNLDLQSRVSERLQLLPIKVQQGTLNLAKTQADIDYINSRIDYTNALAEKVGEDYALRMMEYALDVQKFNQGSASKDAEQSLKSAEALLQAQTARAKIVQGQLEAAQKKAILFNEGTPERAAQDAIVYRLQTELAATNQDIIAATKAIEAITKKPLQNPGGQVNLTFGTVPGGAANSGGGFRPEQVAAATKNVVCRSGAQCAEGLTQVLQNLGFKIPTMLGAKQTAEWALANGGQIVTDPQPGDIVWVQGPGYGGVQANGRRSGHHVELYAGNGKVWNRRRGRWTNDSVTRHGNARVIFIRLPRN